MTQTARTSKTARNNTAAETAARTAFLSSLFRAERAACPNEQVAIGKSSKSS